MNGRGDDGLRRFVKILTAFVAAAGVGACETSYPDFNPDAYRTGLHAYSAGQAALISRDTNTAADHYLTALAHDPDNSYIRGRAFELLISNGRFDEARAIDGDLPLGRAAYGISRMLQVVDAVLAKDYESAEAALNAASGTGFDGLIKPVALAWIKAGAGQEAEAMDALAPLISRPAALSQFAKEHRAMILAYLGKWDEAERAYQDVIDLSGRTSPRIVLDYAARLAQRRDWKGAKAVLAPLAAQNPNVVRLSHVLKQIDRKKQPEILSQSPATGIAEALYRISTEMINRATAPTAILYARLATELRPGFDDAYYLIGEVLDAQDLHLDAYRAFNQVSKQSGQWLYAQLQLANLLADMDDRQAGIALVKGLLKDQPDYVLAHITLGDLYRIAEEFQPASDAYTAAILLDEGQGKENWVLYYSRGITYERLDQWPQAEADFKKALEIKPDDPFVLNYLGYSWIDRGMNYDVARKMIEKAVEQRPNDGYMVDSLGWALYLSGEYEEAVGVLEQAVALQPGDATINDHLGDAYWKVGRRIEARHKWKHTLDLDADEDLIAKVNEKLDLGLDSVEVGEVRTDN